MARWVNTSTKRKNRYGATNGAPKEIGNGAAGNGAEKKKPTTTAIQLRRYFEFLVFVSITSLITFSFLAPLKYLSTYDSNLPSQPSSKHSLENLAGDADDDPYTILHTVTTRFMVGQANVNHYEITKARHLLFETFSWPSLKAQTWQNFYWFVLVDSDLDKRIIGDMKDVLGSREHFPTGNAFLIPTNNTAWGADGVGVPGTETYGVGLKPIAEAFRDGSLEILTGNTDHLLRALDIMDGKGNTNNSKKPIMIIESLSDADDGLNRHFVDWTQTMAVQKTTDHFKQQNKDLAAVTSFDAAAPSLETTWWFLCGTDNLEWHNRDTYLLTNEQYSQVGLTSGLVGVRKAPLYCSAGGFSKIGITSDSHMKFPRDAYVNHALVFTNFPECTIPPTDTTNTPAAKGVYHKCFRREFREDTIMVRSRSITSDSMDNFDIENPGNYQDLAWVTGGGELLLINNREQVWKTLQEDYAVNRTKTWEISVYLYENRQSIAKQNLESRCAPGWPCHEHSKNNLKQLEGFWETKAF